ncbi:hypothetical protein DY467_14050 [Rhodopseudomonas sp. BR0G17]|nr:hypothetical protein [Rhodopseudomonas sp. BR0G17]
MVSGRCAADACLVSRIVDRAADRGALFSDHYNDKAGLVVRGEVLGRPSGPISIATQPRDFQSEL